MNDDVMIAVVELTDENRPSMFRLAVGFGYVGLACLFCTHVYDSVDDLLSRNPVVASKVPDFALACHACWFQTYALPA